MSIIVKYNIPTPVALDALVFVALFAYKNTTIFAYLIGFVLGYLFTADFTLDCFHKALFLRVIKCPYFIKADEIEDVEGSPLAFLEVEIRDGFESIFPLLIVLRAFRGFFGRDEKGRARTKGGAGRTIFLVVGKARKAVIEDYSERLEPPGLFEGEG